ncbi:hypothetical protein PHJA_002166400, partial [Phtheirospermum japonicum]
KDFFEKCTSHDLPKNELNRFCITCEASIFRLYVKNSGHKDHKVLTYQNAVSIREIDIHIHCDNIQSYKCNKKWVVSLNPLSRNGSDLHIESDGACYVCKRKLIYPTIFYFSPLHRDVDQHREKPSKRKRNRKGVPHRMPFSKLRLMDIYHLPNDGIFKNYINVEY